MNWTDSLERRLSRFAIPGLIKIIVGLNALVFILIKLNPATAAFFSLSGAGLARHEYWRLVTFLFVPPTDNFLWILFALYFLWMMGEGLERAMGAFRLNLFYLVGAIATVLSAIFFGGEYSSAILNSSLLFAFAWYYPDVQIFLMAIIPVKIRWAAWISAAFLFFNFVTGTASLQMAIIASLANYLLFFGPKIIAQAKQRQQVAGRRREFAEKSIPEDEALHQCAACRRTEITNPELDFRVSRDGNEYCVEHLPKSTPQV